MALITAKPASVPANSDGGFLSEMLGELVKEVARVFLAGVPADLWPSETHGYKGPPEHLQSCLSSLRTSRNWQRPWDPKNSNGQSDKLSKLFETSFVHQCSAISWEGKHCNSLVSLLMALDSADSAPALADTSPLVAFGHGDLNLANVLVDLQVTHS